MIGTLKDGLVKRIRMGALATSLSVAVVLGSAVPAQAASASNDASNLAAAHHAAVLVARAEHLASSSPASSITLARAMTDAQRAWAKTTIAPAAPSPALMHPDTKNANGHSCHWYGYCDFRLSDSRARQVVDLLNVGAGGSALCAVIGAATGGIATVGCGAVSAILWTASGWISYLVDHYHRGIFIRVFYTGGGYIWHQ